MVRAGRIPGEGVRPRGRCDHAADALFGRLRRATQSGDGVVDGSVMGLAPSLLLFGDPGPMAARLLMEDRLRLLWAVHRAEAERMVTAGEVDLCLLSMRHPEAQDLRDTVLRAAGVPVVEVAAAPSDDATPESVDVDARRALLRLEAHLGLCLSTVECEPVHTTAELIAGDGHWGGTVSALGGRGCVVEGLPHTLDGQSVELRLDLHDGALWCAGVVTRWLPRAERSVASVRFLDLAPPQSQRIHAFLQEAAASAAAEAIFEGLPLSSEEPTGPLSTQDVGAQPLPDEVQATAGEVALPMIRGLLSGELVEGKIPAYVAKVALELTDIERRAALGQDAPSWARRALTLRLQLACARAMFRRRLPSALLDEAYQNFVVLAAEGASESDETMAELGRIRAALLREVLAPDGRRQDAPDVRSQDLVPGPGQTPTYPADRGAVRASMRTTEAAARAGTDAEATDAHADPAPEDAPTTGRSDDKNPTEPALWVRPPRSQG